MYVDDRMVFDVYSFSRQVLFANLGERVRYEDKGILKWFLGLLSHKIKTV